MKTAFAAHINSQYPFLEGKNILIACSGGLDSVVLTRMMHSFGYTISIAHCNFSLRGKESDADAEFVIQLAEDLEIICYTKTFDTKGYANEHGLSTQMAARDLRYQWFHELLDTHVYDYLLTAHHADDDLETFFINLSRGTGLRGLVGIPRKKERLLRPLLSFSREDIFKYAKQEQWYWREDSSNVKTEYMRNQLRHDVIPHLKKVDKNWIKNIQKTQQYLNQSLALVDDYMLLVYNLVVSEVEEGYSFDISKLQELPNTEAVLFELLYPFGFTDFESIAELIDSQTGKEVLSPTHRLLKNREVLLLAVLASDSHQQALTIPEGLTSLNSPLKLRFSEAKKYEVTNAHTAFIDKKSLVYPLLLRKWQQGDRFQPFGLKGKKKLSKFFKDEKLSLITKENTWVLCSENEIVWVVGMRLDDRYKVQQDTQHILRIDYTPNTI